MELYHSKITTEDLVIIYEEIFTLFKTSFLSFQKEQRIEDQFDCRNIFFENVISAIQCTVINSHLIRDHFLDLALWENQNFNDEKYKGEALQNILSHLITNIREALFVTVFVRFENFIKTLAINQNIPGEKINRLTKDLIDKLKIDTKYKVFIDLLTWTRNTMHTEGFHTWPTNTLNYEGNNFEFIQGEPLAFYNLTTLKFILEQMNAFVFVILNCDLIKKQKYIEHLSINLSHRFEQ